MTRAEHPPCNTVKAISSIITLVLVIMGFYLSFQEGRIRQLETKNDSIVRMQRDLEYLSENFKEIKSDVKAILKRNESGRSAGVGSLYDHDETLSRN